MSHDQISEVKVSAVMNSEEEIDNLLSQVLQDYNSSSLSTISEPCISAFCFTSSSEELFSKVEESVPANMCANTKWAVTT